MMLNRLVQSAFRLDRMHEGTGYMIPDGKLVLSTSWVYYGSLASIFKEHSMLGGCKRVLFHDVRVSGVLSKVFALAMHQ